MRKKHHNRNKIQDTRGVGKIKNKPEKSIGRCVREKFAEEQEAKYFIIQPKTQNQEKAIGFLKSRNTVFLTGYSGSGKTFLACVHAANQLTMNRIDKIVLLRPSEGMGKGIGYRKGDTMEKLSGPYQSMIEPLKMVLGANVFEIHLKRGNIVMEPMEDVRGRSYRRSVIIVDEASNTEKKDMQTLVTRLGEGSQIIFCGDTAPWQQDIRGVSGLTYILRSIKDLRSEQPEFLDDEDMDHLMNNIGIVEFTREDVVRSGITKLFVKAFDEGY